MDRLADSFNLNGLFQTCFTFNQPLASSNWNKVTATHQMFDGNRGFQQDVTLTANLLTSTSMMFANARQFNSRVELEAPIVDASRMMWGAVSFDNQFVLSSTSLVTIDGLFAHAYAHSTLPRMHTEGVINFNRVFANNYRFLQDVSHWKVSHGTQFDEMFSGTPIVENRTLSCKIHTSYQSQNPVYWDPIAAGLTVNDADSLQSSPHPSPSPPPRVNLNPRQPGKIALLNDIIPTTAPFRVTAQSAQDRNNPQVDVLFATSWGSTSWATNASAPLASRTTETVPWVSPLRLCQSATKRRRAADRVVSMIPRCLGSAYATASRKGNRSSVPLKCNNHRLASTNNRFAPPRGPDMWSTLASEVAVCGALNETGRNSVRVDRRDSMAWACSRIASHRPSPSALGPRARSRTSLVRRHREPRRG